MTRGFVASATLVVVCVLFGLNDNAKASVVSTFSVNPISITAGQQATLDLTLTANPDSGDTYAYFNSGSVTLYSGIGSSQTSPITYGPSSENFQFTVTYPAAGNYTPLFSFVAYYTDARYYSGYSRYGFYYGWNYYLTNQSGLGGAALTVNAPVAGSRAVALPLPASLPFFATGLGFLGFLGWRRKKKIPALAG